MDDKDDDEHEYQLENVKYLINTQYDIKISPLKTRQKKDLESVRKCNSDQIGRISFIQKKQLWNARLEMVQKRKDIKARRV